MTKQEQKTEALEQPKEAKTAKPEVANKEAQAGMSGLLNDRQKLIQFLKEGGKSGITNDFGKPQIVDGATDTKAAAPKETTGQTESAVVDSPAAGKKLEPSDSTANSYKITPKDAKTGDWEVKPHNETKVFELPVDGKVRFTDIEFPQQANGQAGGSRTLEYGKDGKLNKVSEPDGSSYAKVVGKDGKEHWVHQFPPGVREFDAADYNVTADKTGKLSIENNTDGTRRDEYPDGHAVQFDKMGKPSSVEYLNRSQADVKDGGDSNRHFKYNEKGEICDYTAPNGSHWKSSDGEHWQKMDAKGNTIPGEQNTLEGKMSVNADGKFVFENHREPRHTTEVTPDGHRDNIYPWKLDGQDFLKAVGDHQDVTSPKGEHTDDPAAPKAREQSRDQTHAAQDTAVPVKASEAEQKAMERHHLTNLSPEGQRLAHDALTKISDPAQQEQFLKSMETFEHRDGLSRKEKDDTYGQLSRLLESDHSKAGLGPDGHGSPERQAAFRQILAGDIMQHAAVPTGIDQGKYNTCNVTTQAERMYTLHPSQMAEMAVTTALDGQWVSPYDHKVIGIAPESLEPPTPPPACMNVPPPDGARAYDTQLLNVVMVNDAAQRKVPPELYVQGPSEGNGDNGERLYYWNPRTGQAIAEVKGPVTNDAGVTEEKPLRNPNLDNSEISAIETRLTGDSHFLIDSFPQPTDSTGKPVDDGVVHVDSEAKLAQVLHDMKVHHRLPATIYVDAHNPLFQGHNYNFSPNSAHVVSVTDYDEKTGRVKISNQWGKNNDIEANIGDLYDATHLDPLKTNDWAYQLSQWKLDQFGNVKHDV